MKPLVYVAGPITGDPFGCVRQAVAVFGALRRLGCVPILPQLSVLAEMVEPRPYDEWISYGLDTVERCDAVLRLPGQSPGADAETAHAAAFGVPVFTDLHGVAAWLDERKAGSDAVGQAH